MPTIRPRLTMTRAGLGAGLTIGPLRITRTARGRLSVGLALPRGRTLRGRASSGAVAPGAVGRPGPWAPPQGPPLGPSTRPGMMRERCARPNCRHGAGYHDGYPPGTAPYTGCYHRGCPCRQWLEVDDPAVVGHAGLRDLFGPAQGPRTAGPREGA